MEKLVIVGGGVAGLSCLNALLDRDISPLLLEASMIGSPKMCGEFLAPPALPVLEQWGLGPLPKISQVRFFGGEKVVDLAFMRPAAAYERHQAEVALAAFAKKRGGRIREHAPIKIITPATSRTPYVLHLASGEIMQAEDVIFAT